jgi:hypothetical protein
MFYVVWERYDPHATQFIKYDQLSDFVADLEDPLRIPKPNEITLVSFNLNIMEGDRLHCLDVLMALVRKHLHHVPESEELATLKEQMQTNFNSQFPSRVKLKVCTFSFSLFFFLFFLNPHFPGAREIIMKIH